MNKLLDFFKPIDFSVATLYIQSIKYYYYDFIVTIYNFNIFQSCNFVHFVHFNFNFDINIVICFNINI